MMRFAALWGVVCWSGLARAGSLAAARDCLDHFDLPCAQAELAELQRSAPGSQQTRRVEAWVRFHEGAYGEARSLLEALEAEGVPVSEEEPYTPYGPTAEAAAGLTEVRSGEVRIRHQSGLDTILADQAVDALEAARTTYDGLFGGGPKHPVVLDLYPTANRFIAASGLPPESVRTTNVIALSKWTRLLVTSPRALSRGYGWKDTVAHEYIHLVVAVRTANNAPVWLQEGLAKHLEQHWRGETSGGLDAHAQSILAEAIATDGFVPFEKFRRSMAYLDSSQEAALAFAQVSTMVGFLLENAGEEALPALMDRVRDGEDPNAAFASLAGYPDWSSFLEGWKAWLATLPLVKETLAQVPVVLDGEADEFASDPLFADRPDLARFTRVGDLLRDRGHFEAALVEYGKAEDPEGPPSPLLLARKAECHLGLGDEAAALREVRTGTRLYPEVPVLQVTLGRILEGQGQLRQAASAYAVAQDINPYNPEVQQALVRLYEALGRTALAQRHERYATILATGGAAGRAASPADPVR